MIRFTFQDGTTMHIASSATVVTNKGPRQADQVPFGAYVRCGVVLFCRVDDITTL